MRESRRTDIVLPLLTVLLDACAIEAAFLLSFILRTRTGLFGGFGYVDVDAPPLSGYLLSSLFVIPVWLLLFHARKMYRPRRNAPLSADAIAIVKVVTIGMLIVMSAAFFYRGFSYSRIIFVLLWFSASFLLLAGRMLAGQVERALYRRGRNLRHAVIIGAEAAADAIVQRLNGHLSFGFTMDGYFADAPVDGARQLASIPYLGTLVGAPDTIARQRTELAFIALPARDSNRLVDLVNQCEGIRVEFLMVPDVLSMLTSHVQAEELEGIPFLKLKSIPITMWGRILKRTFDLVVALTLLLLLLPFLLLIAAAIVLTSPGPVFYRQERIGMDGRKFSMIKFRSMRIDAEDHSGPVWAQADDPRRTPIGVLLRKTSIDELPQLLNVVKGEMSLVGPRPERPFFVEQFKDLVPKYLDRHLVRTGMTGWAQVNGLRGDTSLEERIQYDIYYIENWSLAFDIRILLMTIHTALKFKDVH